jgi:hypothetical protein
MDTLYIFRPISMQTFFNYASLYYSEDESIVFLLSGQKFLSVPEDSILYEGETLTFNHTETSSVTYVLFLTESSTVHSSQISYVSTVKP